jgi:excisionase family DNA binding protein
MENKTLGERSSYQLMSLASRIKVIHHAITAEELADLLKVSRLTILRRAKRGTIPSFRVGSCVRFDLAVALSLGEKTFPSFFALMPTEQTLFPIPTDPI